MNRHRLYYCLPVLVASVVQTVAWAETVFNLGTAVLKIDEKGYAALRIPGGQDVFPSCAEPILEAVAGGDRLAPESVHFESNRLIATFPGGGLCVYDVRPGDGFILFDLVRMEFPAPPEKLRLFSLALPGDAEILGTLNAGSTASHTVSLSAAEPNIHPLVRTLARHESDRAGCTHTLTLTDQTGAGQGAAAFTAHNAAEPGGWSVSTRQLPHALNLSGLKAIRAWVHGDGKGEQLKIQPADDRGGCRDTYIPITFTGWRQVTVEEAPYDTLHPERVTGLNIYYNGIPANETVTCLVDHIEAVVERNGVEESVLLEDFEPGSAYWTDPGKVLALETLAEYGLQPARFGVLIAPREAFMEVMERFETAADLPSPEPGGTWNKQSSWIKRSYLFITRFKESQMEPVLALARRGGFDMILMGQESWAKATGHYEINTEHFPGGLESLARTFRRFREEGFHAGLHFLGASIYPPDPYLAPVPDPRLVRDASALLAADVDDNTGVLLTATAPTDFPAEDGGYMGDGTVVQLDDELISYGALSMNSPFGLMQCQRGILGTKAAAHEKGRPVRHLKRSYGYFLFDMDTTLMDEVSSNFARVANACDIDMIYFDGSEWLQGDHWYYNPRLHKAFFDKLARKDILIQASSYSHYSWHILARSASADGHGDLKGYLDERSPAFDGMKRNGMPLDIGWYYGYDTSCTPDMYEYILGATIGYDSSMSFQVSLEAASKHPFTGEILDLISRYEQLRLSGRVPESMRTLLRIDPGLGGTKTPEERASLLDARREYRLVEKDGNDVFQRVVYGPWHEITGTEVCSWPIRVAEGPAAVGVQFHVQPGPWLEAGPAYHAADAVTLETFDTLSPYLKVPGEIEPALDAPNGTAGSTLAGVTHHIRIRETDTRAGGRCAVYTADNTLDTNTGWSVFGKTFNPPIDLSKHKALAFWLKGDGKGGLFKLQLLDGTKAADFYITNDYEGWRYHQIPRPETDPIDYNQARVLNFYYNGLPANTSVTCGIDDVKALASVDTQLLENPQVEIDGHILAWKGPLTAGQYGFLWPGEASRRFGPEFTEPVLIDNGVTTTALAKGEYTARFSAPGGLVSPLRVRVTLQPPEYHILPPGSHPELSK